MRTPVQWNDASVAICLGDLQHVSRSLHELSLTLIVRRSPRPSVVPDDAARIQARVRGHIGGSRACGGGLSPLRFRRQGRNSSIRRIHNQCRAPIRSARILPSLHPILVEVIMNHCGINTRVKVDRLLEGFDGFLHRVQRFSSKLLRSFQGRVSEVQPIPLKVRIAPRGTGRRPTPWSRRGRIVRIRGEPRCRVGRDLRNQDRRPRHNHRREHHSTEGHENSVTHGRPLFTRLLCSIAWRPTRYRNHGPTWSGDHSSYAQAKYIPYRACEKRDV